MKRITKICQNCKSYQIVENENEKYCTNCNYEQLVETHPGNYLYAKNFDKNNFKSYFKFPLYLDEYMDKVFTADNEMAFDFGLSFRENQGINLTRRTMEKIVEVLNLETYEPIRYLDLKYVEDGTITLDNKNFITIRSWGRLTSDNYNVGCFGLKSENAAIIQDNFAYFILSRLTIKKFNYDFKTIK